MSRCDLEQVFGPTADQLPDRDDDTFLISATTLPQPPAHLITEHLVIRTGEHGYQSYTLNLVDALQLWRDGESRCPYPERRATRHHAVRDQCDQLCAKRPQAVQPNKPFLYSKI